jgi:hypothetical protein
MQFPSISILHGGKIQTCSSEIQPPIFVHSLHSVPNRTVFGGHALGFVGSGGVKVEIGFGGASFFVEFTTANKERGIENMRSHYKHNG